MQNENTYHIPVLLKESVDGLVTNPNGTYLDLTFGGGGHSREILSRLEDDGRLFGLDQDIETLKNAPDDPKFTYILSNFRYLKNFMRYHEVEEVDGVLADLELTPGVAKDEPDEPDELVFVSPSILITFERHLFKSTPRFSKTLAATPSPSLIKPSKRCSVPM